MEIKQNSSAANIQLPELPAVIGGYTKERIESLMIEFAKQAVELNRQQVTQAELDPADVIVDSVITHGSGFGITRVNGVKLTHKPTGIEVTETEERSQHRNRAVAWEKLKKLVAEQVTQPASEEKPAISNEDYVAAGWGEPALDRSTVHRLAVQMGIIPVSEDKPAITTCNCRWEGETQVQQCTLHEAHVDAIYEWAYRAKVAEAKLREKPAKVEPVAYFVDTAPHWETTSHYEQVAKEFYGNPDTIPLYTHPAPADQDAQDAARFRWLRNTAPTHVVYKLFDRLFTQSGVGAFEDAIDAAIAGEKK